MVRQVNKDYQSPLMEAYIEEVRRLEERFDGLQTEHVPRAENSIADHLSKCVAQKLPVEPGTFVLHLTQPSVSPTTVAKNRRKLDSGKPLPVEPLGVPGRDPAGNNSSPPAGPHPLAGPMDPSNEACAPAVEEVPLVLVAEPQAPTWERHIVHFLQTGELRGPVYQFVDDTLYRRRPNGVKLKCVFWEDGKELLAKIHKGMCSSHIRSRALVGKECW